MVDSTLLSKNGATLPRKSQSKRASAGRYKHKKLVKIGKVSIDLINEIYGPIDAANRFINLTLETIGEGSQGREFLLESKRGIIKTSNLLKKLNTYAKKMEKELLEISAEHN